MDTPTASAREAILGMDVHAILRECRNDEAAFANIGDAIALGLIDVRADAVWRAYNGKPLLTRGNKLTDLWANIKSAGQEDDVWTSSAVDLAATDVEGVIKIKSIEFSRSDVLRYAQKYGLRNTSEPAPPPTFSVGRPWKRKEWEQFWRAVVRLAYEGKLNSATFPTKAALTRHVHDEIDQALDYETLKKAVSEIANEYGIGQR